MRRRFSILTVFFGGLLLVLSATVPAQADMIQWANWSALGEGSATGIITFPDGVQSTVTYTGQVVGLGDLGDDQIYSRVALVGGNTSYNTIFFSHPVNNPIIAIESLSGSLNSTHAAFECFSSLAENGFGHLENGSTLQNVQAFNGRMENGIFQLQGKILSISWIAQDPQNFHMFTVGAPTHAPLPASVLLLGPGLVGLASMRKWFRK
jgi:hypothetical protein